jgi:eukaryotic-like serine/threonine-protein kinase
VLHRDIKPDNILLDEHNRASVSDFGIARSMSADSTQTLTSNAIGTHYYKCPVYHNEGILSEASDLYGVGIVALQVGTSAVHIIICIYNMYAELTINAKIASTAINSIPYY